MTEYRGFTMRERGGEIEVIAEAMAAARAYSKATGEVFTTNGKSVGIFSLSVEELKAEIDAVYEAAI